MRNDQGSTDTRTKPLDDFTLAGRVGLAAKNRYVAGINEYIVTSASQQLVKRARAQPADITVRLVAGSRRYSRVPDALDQGV